MVSTILPRWSPEEDDKLREVFPYARDEELVKTFNKTVSSIKARAYRLGIKKDRFLLQQCMKENSRRQWVKIKEAQKHALGSQEELARA